MTQELLKDTVITRVNNASGAGTTPITSSVLDMQGFDAVAFVALLGTVTDGSVLTLTAYENTVNSTSGGTAITGGATGAVTASTDSGHVLVSDVIRPNKRYCFCTLTRTTQNAATDAVLAFQYRPKSLPVTQPATVIGSTLGGNED